MANNNLVVAPPRDVMLHSTNVENLFISELLPIAPGDYVKVYLFCLMNAQYNCPIDKQTTSRVLGMTEDEIDNAWAYWEDKGAIVREYDSEQGEYKIVFLSQIDIFYSGGSYEPAASPKVHNETAKTVNVRESHEPEIDVEAIEYMDDDAAKLMELELRGLFSQYEEAAGRAISRKESDKIRDAINVYSVTPDVFSYAIKYCAELEKYNIDYINTVALRWTKEGCKDISQVKELLDKDSKRNAEYARIFKELGFNRMASPGDREIMARWFDEMGFKMSEVLEACRKAAGLREPNLRYVDKVLENKYKEAGGVDTGHKSTAGSDSGATNVSKRVLGEYFEYLRINAERDYQERLEEAERIPMMRDILAMEKQFNKSLVTINFGPNAKEERKAKMEKYKKIEAEKVRVLLENGYPEDFLEKKFKCVLCKDTGVTENGKYCTCVKERAAEAYKWNQKRRKLNKE